VLPTYLPIDLSNKRNNYKEQSTFRKAYEILSILGNTTIPLSQQQNSNYPYSLPHKPSPRPAILFLVAFTKLRIAAISFVTSIRLFVHPRGTSQTPPGRNFVKFYYWGSTTKCQVNFSSNWTNTTGTLHADSRTIATLTTSVTTVALHNNQYK
jgi:hypothetical protein